MRSQRTPALTVCLTTAACLVLGACSGGNSPAPTAATGQAGTPAPTAAEAATLDETWQAAVDAIIADDHDGFLALATEDVHNRLTETHTLEEMSWRDWDVMGGREGESPTVIAGACSEGLEQDYGQIVGDPTVTCRLDYTLPDSSEQHTSGLFYLRQDDDGAWRVVDYTRQYQ